LNHHFHGDNEHTWKVGDGETRGLGTEDGENQSDAMADPMLYKPMDLHECIGDRFMVSKATNRKQKLERKAVRIRKPRMQQLETLSGSIVKTDCPGKNRMQEMFCHILFRSPKLETLPES
jgi:hypothetical protein